MNIRTRTAINRLAAQRFPVDQLTFDVQPEELSAWLSDERVRSAARSNGSRPGWVTRRRVLLAAGLTGVAAAGAVVVLPRLTGSRAYAATPPLLRYQPLGAREIPMDILRRLAGRARSQPPPPGSGPYHYIHTQGWHLATDQMADGRILSSGIEIADREFWVSDDGSGRINENRGGQPSRMSGTYGPGQLTPRSRLEGPIDTLQDTLTRQNPGRTAFDWLAVVQDTWGSQAVSPALQCALLSILATQPGLRIEGTVIDRVGRPGIAVSAGSGNADRPQERYILILDQNTGMLLGFEEIAFEAGGLPIQVPATIAYTVWLASGRTADTSARP